MDDLPTQAGGLEGCKPSEILLFYRWTTCLRKREVWRAASPPRYFYSIDGRPAYASGRFGGLQALRDTSILSMDDLPTQAGGLEGCKPSEILLFYRWTTC